jgi:hypothetical protein
MPAAERRTEPPKSAPSRTEIANARARLAAMKTAEAYKRVWESLPAEVRAEIADAAPKPAAAPVEDGVPLAGKAIIDTIMAQLHELNVNWGQVRDGIEKGEEIAAEAALPKMPVDFRPGQLTAVEALRLHAALKTRVEKKRASAEKRAANKAAKTEEVGATS